jgi:hypothetical protein
MSEYFFSKTAWVLLLFLAEESHRGISPFHVQGKEIAACTVLPGLGRHSGRASARTLLVFGIQVERRIGERIPVVSFVIVFMIYEQRGGGMI